MLRLANPVVLHLEVQGNNWATYLHEITTLHTILIFDLQYSYCNYSSYKVLERIFFNFNSNLSAWSEFVIDLKVTPPNSGIQECMQYFLCILDGVIASNKQYSDKRQYHFERVKWCFVTCIFINSQLFNENQGTWFQQLECRGKRKNGSVDNLKIEPLYLCGLNITVFTSRFSVPSWNYFRYSI